MAPRVCFFRYGPGETCWGQRLPTPNGGRTARFSRRTRAGTDLFLSMPTPVRFLENGPGNSRRLRQGALGGLIPALPTCTKR